MKAAREAGASNHELAETLKMAQRVRMVTIGNHEKMTDTIQDTLKELVNRQKSKEGAMPA
ncbi:MAG: hypothetical protein V1791_15820 [Pseudomonadota bacterium]